VESSVRYIFGEALGDPIADQILTALREDPFGLTRNEIREMFSKHKGSGQIDRALGVLVASDLVRMERDETGGRPAEHWFAVDHAP
jgi:hypothetical protein